jgi:hypothetical protein
MNEVIESPLSIRPIPGLKLAWTSGAIDGVAMLARLRQHPAHHMLPPMATPREFIQSFWGEAKMRKWSGFLWISPGAQLMACTFLKGDEKRVSFPGIQAWIGGGYVERALCFMDAGNRRNKFPLIVDEEGHLKGLRINPIATSLYGSAIAGEAVLPIGKTGWGY